MKVHELKIQPEYFRAVEAGEKRFEARRNDRDFQVGEYLLLQEWSPEHTLDGERVGFTGRKLTAKITYVLRGPAFGVAEGWAILSIQKLPHIVVVEDPMAAGGSA